jgi:hypothetical protein
MVTVYEIHDPLVRTATMIVDALNRQLNGLFDDDFHTDTAEETRELRTVIDRLGEFEDNIDSSGSSIADLEYLLDHFGDFEKVFEATELITKPAPFGLLNFAGAPESVRPELNDLRRMVTMFTPEKLALQKHFRTFIYTDTNFAEAIDYSPFAHLRDVYFLKPEPGILREYLDAVAIVMETPILTAITNPDRQKQQERYLSGLEALHSELEVLALLETTREVN